MKNSGNGKTILITGCSSGIGLYCAKQLHVEGWNVVASARKENDLSMLRDLGLKAVYLDYADEKSIEAAFKSALDFGDGRLEALFNNGAYGQAGAVEDISTDVLRAQFEANFFGWHHLTNLAVGVMRKQGDADLNGSGRIVHCSSVLGFVPYRWRGAYNASKFALEGLAATMRLELAHTGISISLIEPGPITSKFTENGLIHFINNIDVENSVHREEYKLQLKRLKTGGGVNRFRLEPDAVYKKLNHALNAARPKPHYRVTVPTHMMAWAKRLLPQTLLDRLLLRSG